MKYRRKGIMRMTWRSIATLAMVCCVSLAVDCPAQEGESGPKIQYVPIQETNDSPPGLFKTAVIVDKMPLVHTRQLFPFDSQGKLVGEGAAEEQIEQVLENLETVLKDSGSEMAKLVRVNVYALSTSIVARFHRQLSQRLGGNIRPAITSVLTPSPHRGVVVAADAVAGADAVTGPADSGEAVERKRCKSVAGHDQCADAAILPAGGIAYLSGHPEGFDLTTLPTTQSMTRLMKTLGQLNLAPEHVVQVKVFVNPITASEEVLREVQTFFPDQLAPPLVFVEWFASVPVEIEIIAHLPPSDGPAEPVEYFDPPEFRPSSTFSRVALMRADRQIYIAGLYANQPSRGQPQAELLFGQLDHVLKKTGSDMRHLVKATYYVSDDDAARWVDRTRPKVYDPVRPPAASKLMVHGVGHTQRTMTIDMIAVEAE
ncbi:MAG: RidA family protein [Planctomycetota bacterium]